MCIRDKLRTSVVAQKPRSRTNQSALPKDISSNLGYQLGDIHIAQEVRKWRTIADYNWRAGASQPSRPTGTIFLYIIYPALMYAIIFYVILNKRKRLGDCVTFLASGTLEGDTMQRLNALT